MHIVTTQTLFIDAPQIRGACAACLKTGKMDAGPAGVRCGACGFVNGGDSLHLLVRKRREILGMTRREIAGVLGLKPSTVATYENNWPSERYWLETERLVREGGLAK